MQPLAYLIGCVGATLALIARHQRSGRHDTDDAGDAQHLEKTVRRGFHPLTLDAGAGQTVAMARSRIAPVSFEKAVDSTRTGDLWIFRGGTVADRVIQAASNAPINHVGMAVVLEDLPPLMWHAEMGRSLKDQWTGDHHRGVQLHDLSEAVTTWQVRYGQRAWLRQLHPEVSARQEDSLLRAVARLNGVPTSGSPGAGSGAAMATSAAEGRSRRAYGRRMPTARRWSPRPWRRWASCERMPPPTGMTRAGSGAVTRSRWRRAGPTGTRSRWPATLADGAPMALRRGGNPRPGSRPQRAHPTTPPSRG